MNVEGVVGPQEFLERAAVLLADEARHNLILGIARTLVHSPEVYPDYRLYVVSEAGTVQCAAVITPPYNLIVADTQNDAALTALAVHLADADNEVPGAVGNQPTIDRFVAEWKRVSGGKAKLQMAQGVFALDNVRPISAADGGWRPADLADAEVVSEWMDEFIAETLPDEKRDEDRVRKAVTRRLGGETPGAYWLWEAGGLPVSLTGRGNPAGNGIRIGPVYTPPAHRGKGYASALVAAQSQWLLDNGYEFCYLYTDLSNPTSNAIYERIGYRQIAEAAMYGFGFDQGELLSMIGFGIEKGRDEVVGPG
jgi:predicted GNAT family acetyltransferase